MATRSTSSKKCFSVEEANRSLPLVRSIVQDWTTLSTHVAARRDRIAYLMANRNPDIRDVYGDELAEVQSTLDEATNRLDRYIGELLQLGVRPADASVGAVDFPSQIDGEDVYLCWELGQPRVENWRRVEGGRVYRLDSAVAAEAE